MRFPKVCLYLIIILCLSIAVSASEFKSYSLQACSANDYSALVSFGDDNSPNGVDMPHPAFYTSFSGHSTVNSDYALFPDYAAVLGSGNTEGHIMIPYTQGAGFTCINPGETGIRLSGAFTQTGVYGYRLLYLTQSDSLDHLWARSACEDGGSDCYAQLAIFYVDDRVEGFYDDGTIGPLQSVTNGMIRVFGDNDGVHSTNTMQINTPGLYVIFEYTGINDVNRDTDEEDGRGYFDVSVTSGIDHKFQNYYTPDWYKNNAFYDLDSYEELCNHYFGQNGFLSDSTLPADKKCCGDDDGDVGFTSGNNFCTENGWASSTAQNHCQLLVDSDGSPLFLDYLGSTVDDINTLTNGLDACCGDDSHSFTDDFSADIGWSTSSGSPVISDSSIKLQDPYYEAYYEYYFDYNYEYSIFATPVNNQFFPGDVVITLVDTSENEILIDHTKIETTCNLLDSGSTQIILDSFDYTNPQEESCDFKILEDIGVSKLRITLEANAASLESWFDKVSLIPKNRNDDYGFILNQLTSSPYAQEESRYLCTNEFDSSEPNTVTYDSDGQWQWWDARTEVKPFTIHKVGESDVISNGQQWYHCDAYGNDLGKAIPIANQETFDDVIPSNQNICRDIPVDFKIEAHTDISGTTHQVGNYAFVESHLCDATKASDTTLYSDYLTTLANNGADFTGIIDQNYFAGCCQIPTGSESEYLSTKGWEVFSYESDPLNQCPSPCFDRSGVQTIPRIFDPSQDPIGSSVEDEIKGQNPSTGTSTTYASSCELYSTLTYGEVLPHEECVYNENIVCTFSTPGEGESLLTNNGANLCCIQGSCTDIADLTCSEIASAHNDDFLIYDPAVADVTCQGDTYSSSQIQGLATNQECCVGYAQVNQQTIFPQERNAETFMCYRGPQQKGLLGECCGSNDCYNPQLGWSGATNVFDQGNIFTLGSQFYTIASFDASDETLSSVVDRWRHYTIESRTNLDLNEIGEGIGLDDVWSDWTGFDQLTFDIYWSGTYKPSAINLAHNTQTLTTHFSFPLNDAALIANLPQGRWNRVTIDLPQTIDSSMIIDYIYLSLEDTGQSVGTTHIYVDNFVLHNNEVGYDNYYCTGDSRTWIKDLVAIDIDNSGDLSYDEILPYQQACEAQLSFTWTGSECCGSRTQKSDASNRALGEYFSDTWAGCWGGVSVADGQTISLAYDDPFREAHMLYNDGLFHSCMLDEPSFTDVRGEIIDPIEYSDFAIVGDWYCDPGVDENNADAAWLPVSSLPKNRILFGKLYDLAGDRNFSLHCDEPGNINELILSINDPQGNVQGSALDTTLSDILCVMVAFEDGSSQVVEEVVIGAPLVDTADPTYFIDTNLRAFSPFDTSAETIDCSRYEDPNTGTILPMPNQIVDAADFFLSCLETQNSDVDVDVNVFYNKPLNLMYFSFDFIGGSGGFLSNLWNAVLSFFSDLFGSSGNIIQSGSAPAIGIDLLFESDFRHVYLARLNTKDDLVVKGIMERVEQTTLNDPYEDLNYNRQARIDYVNFANDFYPLINLTTSSDLTENKVTFCQYNATQSLYLDIPAGTFFDWRYLTSSLRLSSTGANPLTFDSSTNAGACLLHNGVLDPGEECDDTYDQWQEIVVHDQSQSLICSQRDPQLLGTISRCVDGVLDESQCSIDAPVVLFVTSSSYDGDLASFGGPDALCINAAASVVGGYTDDARALISTSSQNARDILASNVAVYNNKNNDPGQRQTIVANSNDLFPTGGFSTAIDLAYDESGTFVTGSVWTGSDEEGRLITCGVENIARTCVDWTSSEPSVGCSIYTGMVGNPLEKTFFGNWFSDDDSSQLSCDQGSEVNGPATVPHRIYCVVPVAQGVA